MYNHFKRSILNSLPIKKSKKLTKKMCMFQIITNKKHFGCRKLSFETSFFFSAYQLFLRRGEEFALEILPNSSQKWSILYKIFQNAWNVSKRFSYIFYYQNSIFKLSGLWIKKKIVYQPFLEKKKGKGGGNRMRGNLHIYDFA